MVREVSETRFEKEGRGHVDGQVLGTVKMYMKAGGLLSIYDQFMEYSRDGYKLYYYLLWANR